MNDPLTDLLNAMTPTERATYDTIQRAVAAYVLTPTERANLNTLANDANWVNDLRRRITTQKRTNVRLMQ